MIITTKELFAAAYKKFSIGAYNINNLEQILGLFKGNADSKAPFVLQISRGARSYTDKSYLEALIRQADKNFPELIDRKSTRLNSSHSDRSRMPSSA